MKEFRKRQMLLLCAAALLFAGCAGNTGQKEETAVISVQEDGKTAVAKVKNSSLVLENRSSLAGDALYYTKSKWDEESRRECDTVLYRKTSGEKDAQKVLELGMEQLIAYTVGAENSVYVLSQTDSAEGALSFLRKVNEKGETVYSSQVEEEENGELASIYDMKASVEGNLFLLTQDGTLFLLDKDGKLACRREGLVKGEESICLVNAGGAGVYLCRIQGRKLLLQKINPQDGSTEKGREVCLPDESRASLAVFDGYERGVLITDSDCLWCADMETGPVKELLRWNESTVNLKDYTIDAIGVLPQEELLVLAHRSYEDTVLVQIERKEPEEIQEKQTVTLAVIEGVTQEYTNEKLEELAAEFNRSGGAYQVECVSYPSDFELHTALIQGEGPDIFDFGNGRMDIRALAQKGVLENLSPYFAESKKVKEEQLLTPVCRAGTVNGELVCIFPYFTVNGFVVKKGAVGQEGWTTEQYLELGKAHPEAALFDFGDTQYYKNDILRTVLTADMGSYIDWEEKQCHFDEPYFISILDAVSQLPTPENTVLGDSSRLFAGGIAEVMLERFQNGELLTDSFTASGIGGFNYLKEREYLGGDFAELTGYPNREGIPFYKMECPTPLGMNSASSNKDGAWAFLEFLLSEEYQEREELRGFPGTSGCI